MDEEFDFYTTEIVLRPTCYIDAAFDRYEPVAANDGDYDDCENLYAMPC